MFSQIDPKFKDEKLPNSNLTIGGWGCFLCSLSNLAGGKIHPLELMKTPNGFVKGGLLVSGVLAQALGMERSETVKTAPKGWCIGVTDHYKNKGVPTHFVCVNMQTKKMIDPLAYPAKIEDNTYKYFQYRTFEGVPALDLEKFIPDWAEPAVEMARMANIQTDLTTELGKMKLYHLLMLLLKFFGKAK